MSTNRFALLIDKPHVPPAGEVADVTPASRAIVIHLTLHHSTARVSALCYL